MRKMSAIIVLLFLFSCAGDDDSSCSTGNKGCACYDNNTCNGALSCLSSTCVDLSDAGSAGGSGGSPGITDGAGGAGTGGGGQPTAGSGGGVQVDSSIGGDSATVDGSVMDEAGQNMDASLSDAAVDAQADTGTPCDLLGAWNITFLGGASYSVRCIIEEGDGQRVTVNEKFVEYGCPIATPCGYQDKTAYFSLEDGCAISFDESITSSSGGCKREGTMHMQFNGDSVSGSIEWTVQTGIGTYEETHTFTGTRE